MILCRAGGVSSHHTAAVARWLWLVSGFVFLEERPDLRHRFVARYRVTLLNQTGQFLLMAFDVQQFVVGQMAPGDLPGTDLLFPYGP